MQLVRKSDVLTRYECTEYTNYEFSLCAQEGVLQEGVVL